MPGDPSCHYRFPGRRKKLTTAALIVTLPFDRRDVGSNRRDCRVWTTYFRRIDLP